MWDVFLKVLATAFHVIVLVIAVISIVVWIRSPTRLPLYIHVLAFGAFLLGLLFTLGGQGWFYVILFPGIVYVVFIAKSGGETAQTARETRASQKQTEGHDRFVQPESERFGDECNGGDDENLDMALAPPVFVFEGTDLLLFQSLGDAEIGLEGPDVADGVYESFDSAGHRVALSAQGVEKVRMVVTLGQVVATLDSHSPPDSKKLTQLIQEHLTAVGHPQKTDVPLDELVKRCLDFHEWHR